MRKDDFPLLLNNASLVYLDSAATTQKPRQVIQAMVDFYQKTNANVHRGIYTLSEKASLAYEKAHETVARFINATPTEIIFTSGTTASINLVASALDIQSGDEIIVTALEHHSNFVPWQQLAKLRNAVFKIIPVTEEGILDMVQAAQLITAKTKIVAVAHISNVLGTINPVKEIVSLAHQQGALCLVDAAQSVPHMPIDVKQLDCDFLAFSGHKMCGPTGIGVLYGKQEALEKLHPCLFGGGMIEEVTREETTFAVLPARFEAGTPPIAQAIGLARAIEYLQEIGMETIAAHDRELTQYAKQQLSSLPGVKVLGPADVAQQGPVISFVVEGIHPHDLSEVANRFNIALRAGNHCAMPLMQELGLSGTARISFYFYNTTEDIDHVITAINKAQEVFQ